MNTVKPLTDADTPWRHRASELIERGCAAAWSTANHDRSGKRYRTHHPYRVPDWCEKLLLALNTNDEELAKAVMMHDYDIQVLEGRR